ncbi:MAG: hypothetical protein JOZ51_09660 [Chloroflexi bacterium]|nr:hypothetical protein [Chloroflexota bacterium]
MFQRLVVLALLAIAALSASTPAHASTPVGAGVMCYQANIQWPWFATYRCIGYASGGTGSYVSYTWKFNSSYGNSTYVTSQPEFDFTCSSGQQFQVDLYVTDSAGAIGSVMGDYYTCNTGGYEPIE